MNIDASERVAICLRAFSILRIVFPGASGYKSSAMSFVQNARSLQDLVSEYDLTTLTRHAEDMTALACCEMHPDSCAAMDNVSSSPPPKLSSHSTSDTMQTHGPKSDACATRIEALIAIALALLRY